MTDNDKDIPLWALDKAAQAGGCKDWKAFKNANNGRNKRNLVKVLSAYIAKYDDPPVDPSKCDCGDPATTEYDWEPVCQDCYDYCAKRDLDESEIIK